MTLGFVPLSKTGAELLFAGGYQPERFIEGRDPPW